MVKTAAPKTYRDPALNKIIQDKAAWNRQVSTFINDVIHFKKSMNGWPSKFYKERVRISQPSPIDLSSILSQIAGDFQEITNQGANIVKEQRDFAQAHVKRQSDRALDKLDKVHGPTTGPAPAAAPKPGGPDLSKQMGQKMSASISSGLVKLASEMELKYELEIIASNPISRFVTRLFNPKFGFGEKTRIRRLRMEMLDNCVKSYKELKKLHKEIVKSSKDSIVVSHKMMTQIWNYWNTVNRFFSTYKIIRPDDIIKDPGGQIETDPELKREKDIEEGRDPDAGLPPANSPSSSLDPNVEMIKDYIENVSFFSSDPEIVNRLRDLSSVVERVLAAPKNKRLDTIRRLDVPKVYANAISLVNTEWGTNGSSFKTIIPQRQALLAAQQSQLPTTKEAQRQLGKIRHQLIPGAISGQRLEVYRFITQIRKDLDVVMNLLESGFDQEKLSASIGQVNREMAALRTMMRSLYYSVKPEEASSPFM